ncbi:MAG: ABC transporter permease [Acidobacteria bacterium]|nr:ABC transporter permease [Acidobacteriota bacterium]
MTFLARIASIFQQAAAELWRHRLRSVLTMFGISWGVIALALITSSGEGFKQGQRENMKQIGDGIVLVWGGRTGGQAGGQRAGRPIRLRMEDIRAIREQCPAIETVAPEVKNYNVPAESDFNAGRFLVVGVDPEYLKIRTLPAETGRNIRRNDVEQGSRICVLGNSVKEQLFEKRPGVIGSTVRIGGHAYGVVGLMSEKNQDSTYDGWDNDKILVPGTSLIRDFPQDHGMAAEGRLNMLIYKAKSESRWEEAQEQLRRTLGNIHGFQPDDETALAFWDTVKDSATFDGMFRSIGFFLGAVALVTLALGGVGIMNTMFTSVAERTPEIGIKKALGAKRSRILWEFFLEGLVLAGLSGGAGILLALGLASFVNSFPMPAYFSGLPMNAVLVLKLTLVLGGVAVLAAMPPALRASRMDPVVAMNCEK